MATGGRRDVPSPSHRRRRRPLARRDSPDFDYFDRVEEWTESFCIASYEYTAVNVPFSPSGTVKPSAESTVRTCGCSRSRVAAKGSTSADVSVSTSSEHRDAARSAWRPFPQAISSTLPPSRRSNCRRNCAPSALHFESACVASYLAEAARLLRPGGLALLHHSNYDAQPAARVGDTSQLTFFVRPR